MVWLKRPVRVQIAYKPVFWNRMVKTNISPLYAFLSAYVKVAQRIIRRNDLRRVSDTGFYFSALTPCYSYAHSTSCLRTVSSLRGRDGPTLVNY